MIFSFLQCFFIDFWNFKLSGLQKALPSCSQKHGRQKIFFYFFLDWMDIMHLHSIKENVAQYNLKINIAGGREQICLGELARTLTDYLDWLLLLSGGRQAVFSHTAKWSLLPFLAPLLFLPEFGHVTHVHRTKCQIFPHFAMVTGHAAFHGHKIHPSPDNHPELLLQQ